MNTSLTTEQARFIIAELSSSAEGCIDEAEVLSRRLDKAIEAIQVLLKERDELRALIFR